MKRCNTKPGCGLGAISYSGEGIQFGGWFQLGSPMGFVQICFVSPISRSCCAPCPGLEKMLEMIDEEEEEKQENKARWRVKWYPCITNHRGF